MKIMLIALLSIFLAACVGGPLGPSAKYSSTKWDETTGHKTSEIIVISERDLVDFVASYNPTTGAFEGSVGATTVPASPLEQAMADMIPILMQRFMGGGVAIQNSAGNLRQPTDEEIRYWERMNILLDDGEL